MHYSKIYRADIANGEGFRVSLFVSGCARHCRGCFNPESWNPEFGQLFDEEAKQKIFNELAQPWCRGISLLGGEPLSCYSDNRKTVIALCREVKEKFPDKDIWLFTGFTLDEIKHDSSMFDILDYASVIVDGPFIEELKDLSIPFRGSSNQRILRQGTDF